MVKEAIEKAVDWLGRQQTTVVVLLAILGVLFYGLNTHIPGILTHFANQAEIQREFDKGQCDSLRQDFSKSLDRVLQSGERQTEMLLRTIEKQEVSLGGVK